MPRPRWEAAFTILLQIGVAAFTVLSSDLSSDLFEAAAMRAVSKDLMAMKVDELKLELEARDEGTSGNKAWLRRRLHAAIVREHLEAWQ